MFTGQTKELFEKWCVENLAMSDTHNTIVDYRGLLYCPFSMQQGVYLQFLREQGIRVTIDVAWENGLVSGWYYQITQDNFLVYDLERNIYPDYDAALTEAITKAGELLHERSGK